jgi:MarR family transcriptional regulator for hemolysin
MNSQAAMPKSFDSDFLFLMHDVARLMRTRADQRARHRGMTRAQWVILARLERQPGMSQNELAALAEVEPITIGRLVDRLEARGFVERRPDPHARRLRRLHLRPAPAAVLSESHAYRGEMHDLLTAGIDAARVDELTRALIQMKANLLAESPEAAKVS